MWILKELWHRKLVLKFIYCEFYWLFAKNFANIVNFQLPSVRTFFQHLYCVHHQSALSHYLLFFVLKCFSGFCHTFFEYIIAFKNVSLLSFVICYFAYCFLYAHRLLSKYTQNYLLISKRLVSPFCAMHAYCRLTSTVLLFHRNLLFTLDTHTINSWCFTPRAQFNATSERFSQMINDLESIAS